MKTTLGLLPVGSSSRATRVNGIASQCQFRKGEVEGYGKGVGTERGKTHGKRRRQDNLV